MTKELAAGVRKLKTYTDNPFTDLIEPNIKKRTEILYDGKQAVINRETREITEDSLAIARVKWVESDQFVKLYTANVSIFFELTKSAQRVCEFVIHLVGLSGSINNDRITLFYEDYKEFFEELGRAGGSPNTFNRGIRELAGKALIAKANRPNQWYINPAVMFNGDRARFITEVRKKKQTHQEQLEDRGQGRLEI